MTWTRPIHTLKYMSPFWHYRCGFCTDWAQKNACFCRKMNTYAIASDAVLRVTAILIRKRAWEISCWVVVPFLVDKSTWGCSPLIGLPLGRIIISMVVKSNLPSVSYQLSVISYQFLFDRNFLSGNVVLWRVYFAHYHLETKPGIWVPKCTLSRTTIINLIDTPTGFR